MARMLREESEMKFKLKRDNQAVPKFSYAHLMEMGIELEDLQ